MTASRTFSQRIAAHRRGHRAELLAAFALMCTGHRILARRFKTPVGEIDLIARRGDLVLFVEVKARADHAAAVDAVSYRTKQRIVRAARWWMSRQRDHARLSPRFDIITVAPRCWPRHLKNAW